jgi:hypothetical protein
MRDGPRLWNLAAVVALTAAGLTGLGYAGWVLTARRALFADIAEAASGNGVVTLVAARSSDALDDGWLLATTVLGVLSLLLWAVAGVVERRRLGSLGFAGLLMLLAGLFVVVVGSLVASLVGADPTDAGRAVIGYAVIGTGFVLVSLGLLAAAGSLLRPQPGEGTYLGFAGWSSG